MAFTLIWFSIFNCQHMWVISGPHWLDPFLALDDAACVSPLMSMVVRVIQSWGVFKRNNCSALGFSQGGFQTHGCYCRTVSAGHIAYCISKSWWVLRLILLLVRLAGLPTYSDPPIFTPISDPDSADSDIRYFTPLFEFSRMGFEKDRVFVLIASRTSARSAPRSAGPISEARINS